jgi:four helix bundle protein
MKKELLNRTKKFAYSCIDLVTNIPSSTLNNHVKNQLIRSSTSVAANYRASCHAQTKAAFIAKISIVVEECDETEFWLQLLIDKNIISTNVVTPILKEANELTSIFVSSRKTAHYNLQKEKI